MISIVIPNFNKEQYLRETLDSVLNQTYVDWEAIIVDDGSTDSSRNVISEYVEKDHRFKPFFLEKQTHGGASCRNFGMKQALGEYIMFLDSDDILMRDCLENRIKFMRRFDHVDFGVFTMESFVTSIIEAGRIWEPIEQNALEKFLSHDLPWQTMQPLYKKQFLRKEELNWRENISRMQDVFFHTDCLLCSPLFKADASAADCKFRVDSQRKVILNKEFYKNWSNAVLLYVSTYRNVSSEYEKYLVLALIRALQVLHQSKIKGEISKFEFASFASEFSLSMENRFFTVYSFILRKLPFHVKGLQFIFLKLINFS